jgi:hypothetical protein
MEIVKSDNKEVVKSDGIFDKIKEDMLMEVIEGALPKIKPFLAPALEKFNEWFGEDDKLIIIKKNKGASIKVIILDNNKGEYEIKNGDNKCFSVQKESIIGVYPIDDFMGKIISGEFTKPK